LALNHVQIAAAAQGEQTGADGVGEVGHRASLESPAQYERASAEQSHLATQRAAISETTVLLQQQFMSRLDRTRHVVWKVLLIYLVFATGEVALNASSAVSVGEAWYLAVPSFLGLAAGTLAAGWVVGQKIRDAVDRREAGPLPDWAKGRGLEALFQPAPGRFSAVPLDLIGWLAALALLAVGSGVLVSQLRLEAGMSSAWGLLSAALVFVAAAPPYLLRNRVADMYEDAENRAEATRSRMVVEATEMDRHTSAQRLTLAARQAAYHQANAAYLAALAGGFGEIVTRQTHLAGHWAPVGAMPLVAEPFAATQPVPPGPEDLLTDHDRARLRAAQAAAADHSAPSAPTPAPTVPAPITIPWPQVPGPVGAPAHQHGSDRPSSNGNGSA
jgi:hypothetical protein